MNSFVRALRTPELRAKIFFTLGMIAIYRLGVFVPTPGFEYTNVMICADQALTGQGAGVMGMVNMFSGGALMQLSIFSLGVMPYITASIIVQLLRVVIPRFEALHKEGQAGTAKLTQYTRYLTIGLAVPRPPPSSPWCARATSSWAAPWTWCPTSPSPPCC